MSNQRLSCTCGSADQRVQLVHTRKNRRPRSKNVVFYSTWRFTLKSTNLFACSPLSTKKRKRQNFFPLPLCMEHSLAVSTTPPSKGGAEREKDLFMCAWNNTSNQTVRRCARAVTAKHDIYSSCSFTQRAAGAFSQHTH